MALATHPGVITRQDSDLAVPAKVYAIPLTEGQVIVDSDGIHIGTAVAETDSSGVLQGGGLKNRIKTGVLWDVIVEPKNGDPKWLLISAGNLNTSGQDLKDIASTVPLAVDAATIDSVVDAANAALASQTAAAASATAAAASATAAAAPTDAQVATLLGNPASSTRVALTRTGSKPVGQGENVYHVADYASISAALTAVPAGATLLLSPNTTYSINNITTATKDVTVQGMGSRSTILNTTSTNGFANGAPASPIRLTFKDIGFTGATNAHVRGGRQTYKQLRFIDCRFSGITDKAIELQGADLLCVRCEFEGEGVPGAKYGISHAFGSERITIRDCTFRFLNRGMYIPDTSGAPRDITVSGCTFDGGWCFLKSTASNSGGTVTYTSTVLTDTAAAFGTLVVGSTVRAMATKRTGNATSVVTMWLTDTGANFTTAGVKRGDIVRTATAWGVVDEVVSATVIKVEQWLNQSDFDYANVPATTTAYTVYGTIIGQVASNTATTITVTDWRDWDGATSTPAAGTMYELAPMAGYQGFFGQRADHVTITGNVFKRSWADQIAPQSCRHVIITDNQVYDGQDYGITCSGGSLGYQEYIVANNRVYHQGSGGIFNGAFDSLIHGNEIIDPNWLSPTGSSAGGITFNSGSSGSRAVNNIIKRINHPFASKAVSMLATVANVYLENEIRGYDSANHLYITGTNVTNVRGKFQPGTIVTLASSAVGPRGEFSGAGVPAIPASQGSTYQRTDGGAGTSFYVKETASSSTTWAAK